MTETPVQEDVTLRDERAEITRQAVDRPASEAEMRHAFKESTIEVRETREEPVVSKTARVIEEVSVGKKISECTETVRDTVRRTDVDVEQVAADTTGATAKRPPMKRYGGQERRMMVGRPPAGVERRMAMQ